MAFDRKNFSGSVGAGSSALKVYTFRDSASTKAEMDTDDYFNDLANIVEVGDVVICHGSDGAVALYVSGNTDGAVTTAEVSLA